MLDSNKGGDAPSHADIMSRYKRLVTARTQTSTSSEATAAGKALESTNGANEIEISNCQQIAVAVETSQNQSETQLSEPSVMPACDCSRQEQEEVQVDKGKLNCFHYLGNFRNRRNL